MPEQAKEEEERTGRPPAKYVNSSETRLFKKSQHFYGLDLARDVLSKTRQVTVVEGYTDVILAVQAGVDNVIGVLGTALGTDHIRVLRRLADRITLVLDGDTAGQKRANEILDLFVAEGVDLRIATLPAGLDPCDYVQQFGGQSLRELVDRAPDALEHKIAVATLGIDPATDTHRAHQALEDVLATLSRLPRKVAEAASLRLREQQVLLRLARTFRVEADQIQARLKELKRKSGRPAQSEETAPRREDTHSVEEELLEILIAHPEMASDVLDRVAPEQLAAGLPQQLYVAYCRLHDAGQPIEFGRVMVELEDPQLKSLLVELDERSRDKSRLALQAVEARIESVRTLLRERRTAEEQRRRVAALEVATSGGGDEDDLEILRELIEQERNRQGIVAPTDG
jgi:DNA primase